MAAQAQGVGVPARRQRWFEENEPRGDSGEPASASADASRPVAQIRKQPRLKPSVTAPFVGCAILTLAFALRVLDIGAQSLWFDEVGTVHTAANWTLAGESPEQVPLHYLALRYWMLLAGQTEFAVRLLSLAFGLASVPLFYQVLRRFKADVGPALAGCAVLAVSALHIYYSQEARMHAMACFSCILAAYMLIRACQRGDRWSYLGYCASAAACLYTFAYSGFVLLGLNLGILIAGRRPTKSWWLSNGLVVGSFAPWLVFAYSRLHPWMDNRLSSSLPPPQRRSSQRTALVLPSG